AACVVWDLEREVAPLAAYVEHERGTAGAEATLDAEAALERVALLRFARIGAGARIGRGPRERFEDEGVEPVGDVVGARVEIRLGRERDGLVEDGKVRTHRRGAKAALAILRALDALFPLGDRCRRMLTGEHLPRE